MYSKAVTLTHTTTSVGTTAGVAQTVTTGAGDDNITLTTAHTGDASSGTVVVISGAGADTIALTTGTLANAMNASVSVTGGTGADIISLTHVNGTGVNSNIELIVAAGDALTTAAGLDTVTGFLVADGANVSDLLNFSGTGAVGALATITDCP